jgi:hypothetical protein
MAFGHTIRLLLAVVCPIAILGWVNRLLYRNSLWKWTFFAVLRIRDVYPGSEFFHPRSRNRIKEFKYFIPKKLVLSSRKFYPGCSSWSESWFLTHPGSRGQKGTGSRIRIRNTAFLIAFKKILSIGYRYRTFFCWCAWWLKIFIVMIPYHITLR